MYTMYPFSYLNDRRPQRQNHIDIYARSTPLYQLIGLSISKLFFRFFLLLKVGFQHKGPLPKETK